MFVMQVSIDLFIKMYVEETMTGCLRSDLLPETFYMVTFPQDVINVLNVKPTHNAN